MTKWKKALVGSAVLGGVLLGTTGCLDKAMEPYKDAPRSGTTNNAPADVIEFPDGFSNLATKCDHGNRVYVAFKGDMNRAAVAVVPNAPGC